MTLTISAELEQQVRERAEAAGMTMSAYVEKLIRDDEPWRELPSEEIEHTDEELAEIQAAIDEGMAELDRGEEGAPAEEFFAELRARRGLPR